MRPQPAAFFSAADGARGRLHDLRPERLSEACRKICS